MESQSRYRARSDGDAVSATMALMRSGEVRFGEGLPPSASHISAQIRFRGPFGTSDTRTVWVEHPPSFLSDHLTAAALMVFGLESGSIRPVQGEPGILELRRSWPNPLTLVIREKVHVRILDPDARQKASEVLVVETSCYPGCDPRAVILASALHCCERKYGTGVIAWVPGSDTQIEFCQGHINMPVQSAFRFTVHRPGGSCSELIVQIPGRQANNWDAILYAVSKKCVSLFGYGSLRYLPEAAGNEVHFSFG